MDAWQRRVGRALLGAHFGGARVGADAYGSEFPAKRARIERLPKVICEINDKTATIKLAGDPYANIFVVFDHQKASSYGYEDVKEDLVFHARIAQLYSGHLPRGKIRQLLCQLLNTAVAKGYLSPDSNVCLEASGAVDGSFSLLIQMYQRMSFMPMGVDVDDASGYTVENLKRDVAANRELPDNLFTVLMASTVKNVLAWCGKKFGATQPLDCDAQ